MSLDGLRAWIAEVERKLGMRTRVFLALSAIAIGIGGAAMYLAIDARDSSVSESDVQELQQQLEDRIDELGAGAVTEPLPPSGAGEEPEEQDGDEANGGTGGTDGDDTGGTGGDAANGGGGAEADSPDRLDDLLEEGREGNGGAE